MKKSLKLFLAGAIVAVSFGVSGIFSTNKVVCGNIEALTSGESFEFEEYPAYKGINDPEAESGRIRGTSGDTNLCSWSPCTTTEDGVCREIVIRP